jgi:hypothetical protein
MFNSNESTEFSSDILYTFKDGVKDITGKLITSKSKKDPNVAVILKWCHQRENNPAAGFWDLCYEDLNGLQGIVRYGSLDRLQNAVADSFIPNESNIGKANFKRYQKRYQDKSVAIKLKY